MKLQFIFIGLLLALVLNSQAQNTIIIDNAQDDEVKTLLNNNGDIDHGFYCSFNIGYSPINNTNALVSGGRLGWIINHGLALGFAGVGFASDISNYDEALEDDEYTGDGLTGGYGGLFVEPIIMPLQPIHFSFPVLFATGGVTRVDDLWDNDYQYNYERNYYDLIWVVEPGIDVEVTLTKWFRLAGYFTYRFAWDVDIPEVENNDLSSWSSGIRFKFGIF